MNIHREIVQLRKKFVFPGISHSPLTKDHLHSRERKDREGIERASRERGRGRCRQEMEKGDRERVLERG